MTVPGDIPGDDVPGTPHLLPHQRPAAVRAAAHLAAQLETYAPVACQVRPDTWWFPERGGSSEPQTAAIHLCAACPVTTACLDYALAADERFGIWGGTTPTQRTTLRKDTP
ncbi:Transcription factor WhiB [Klenkia soli]|uniref:Transcriptional regulator WhiB n=1 Tax=Klenkia soli TaxID=1052260 RepID=A0A1H0SYN9_9ACTN|nr:WhiB family transcriptional regulator [Klenkia soli]SDP46338.1 Transcription factor WhiB [Klenkia soli]